MLNRLGSEAASVADTDKFASAFNAVQKLVRNRALLAAHDVSAGGLITALLEMTFGNVNGGIAVSTEGFAQIGETDLIKILFAENPALVIQVADAKTERVENILNEAGVRFCEIGNPQAERAIIVNHDRTEHLFAID